MEDEILVKLIYNEFGRGLASTKFIPKGTVVFDCPCIRIPIDQIKHKDILNHYVFYSPTDISTNLLSLGLGSLFNHNTNPNIEFKEIGGDFIRFTSLRDIEIGEELFINYGYDPIDVSSSLKEVNENIKLFSLIKSGLMDAPVEVKKSFNNIIKYFSNLD